jgi:Mg2+ and Co2+ transporter CorA
VDGHYNRLEQQEDRITEFEDKIEVKEKTELLVQQLKSCEKSMQELSDSIKRPNSKIMGIEEEEVQAKGIHNAFNKIISENFPNLKKPLPIQVQEASRTPNGLDQSRTSLWHIIIK